MLKSLISVLLELLGENRKVWTGLPLNVAVTLSVLYPCVDKYTASQEENTQILEEKILLLEQVVREKVAMEDIEECEEEIGLIKIAVARLEEQVICRGKTCD